MCIAAAYELARYVEDKGALTEDCIMPTMNEWEVFPKEAAAVGTKAVEQGVARISRSYDELYNNAVAMIQQSQQMTRLLMKEGFIPQMPE
jgi:malate dehydrogenase (oxaloacetate-decarboxylating)